MKLMRKKQLSSIVNEATAEAVKSLSDYRDFKEKLNLCLIRVGCEIVV
mgnify:CR=1 FL=1